MLVDHLQKTKKLQKNEETGDSRYIYQNKLGKACFQHDMAYGDFKIKLEEQLLIKYCMIKYLIMLKIQTMMDIKINCKK